MRSTLILLLGSSIWACRSEEKEPINTNSPPVADAGADIKQSSDQPAVLDGGGSYDPDGDSLTYLWTFNRVPSTSALADSETAFTTNSSATSATTFVPDVAGIYIVNLEVKDTNGDSSPIDSVIVTIEEGQLPVANAGVDMTVMELESVTIDGTSSFDPLGRELSFTWSISSSPVGSTAALIDSTQAQASFVPDIAGVYLLSLIVDNGVSQSSPDVALVKVKSASPLAPTALAGEDFSAEDCTDIALSGSDSFDPNGDPLSYFWSLQERPNSSSASNDSFSNREVENPTFFADTSGTYYLSLAVSDGTDWSAPHMIQVTVEERNSNVAPTVNAGNPITIDAGDASCQLSGYSYICDECESVSVNLGVGATVSDADGDVYTYEWSVLEGDATIVDPTSLTSLVVLDGAEPTEPSVCDSTEYQLQLAATDCPEAQTTDVMVITVNCCGVESTE
jgi:hypothetical protein